MAREGGITILKGTDLKYLLIDSLRSYSDDVQFISGKNPYLFNINKKPVYILIKNLHDSGKGRGNRNECRIQIQKSSNLLPAKNSGKPLLIFGYSDKHNTLTAWNPFMYLPRINGKKVVSLYSRFSLQEKTIKQGIAEYVDKRGQRIISFKPEYLGLYLENFQSMHQSDEKALLKLIQKSEEVDETEEQEAKFSIESQKFTVTHKKFKRDISFRRIIYEAYNHRCAICGIQLELVEAAHIVPHADEKGNDDPQNGVCLCSLHHTAYDKGLIYFDEQYKVLLNEAKMDYLQKIKKDGGFLKFTKLQEEKLFLPTSKVFYPSKEYIKVANKIRGILNE